MPAVGKLDELEWFQPADRADWRRWLAAHHTTSEGVWVVTWRKAAPHPSLDYEDIVEEALAYGWIDSKGGRVDDERTRLLLTPRRAGSGWSRPNKQRIARLEAAGLMAPAGAALIEAAKADGSWTLLDDVEDLVVPVDLAAALEQHPGARAAWDALPRSPRRSVLEQLATAKRPETRAKRAAQAAERVARGERP